MTIISNIDHACFFKEKNRCQNITFERFAKEKQRIMHREVVATENERKQTDRQGIPPQQPWLLGLPKCVH